MERRILLVSDVDNTLLGDDNALEQFADWYEGMRGQLWLAYASGRFVDSLRQSIRSTRLPEPRAIIGGVGTDVCDATTGQRAAGWPKAGRWDNGAIRGILGAYSELQPQPSELQSEFKISYYGYNLSPSFLQSLRSALNQHGYAVETVYSSDRDLDVLPEGVNKGSAAAFLADYLGVSRDEVFVSGDSGNDLALFQQGFRGIVVANAHADLKTLNGPRIYHSPHAYAAGVLDGLQHWLAKVPA